MNCKNINNKTLKKINILIGIVFAIIGVLIYITRESKEVKSILMIGLVIVGIILLTNIFENSGQLYNSDLINLVVLVNEDNNIIKEWNLSKKVSMIIGKNNKENKVDIDLSESIYSNLIDNYHAVLNYAGGEWYIEDLCSQNGISIGKKEDSTVYRVDKYSPCIIKKGDILFIGKIKLLLR